MRIFVIFFAVPFFHLIWRCNNYVKEGDLTLFERLIQNFTNFDAIHFQHVTSKGYLFEINHAFFPMFPYIISSLATVLKTTQIAIISFFVQLLISYTNCILIYRVGKKVFGGTPQNDKIAELSAYFYIVSLSTVY
jgi:Gpi18-like mannosyltransferase